MCAEYNVPLAGIVPADEDVGEADRAGILLGEGRGAVHEAVDRIVAYVDEHLGATAMVGASSSG